ncbi:MAG: hypothetical protein AB1468_02135 [Candidatus Micrarchaeota archaeon]
MPFSLFEAISEIHEAFRKRDINRLRKASNKCAASTAVDENRQMLSLALTSYALSKILEKTHYVDYKKKDEFTRVVSDKLRACVSLAKEGKTSEFDATLNDVRALMESLDERKKRYARNLFDKARLKVASTLYAQGFSLSRAVEFTGADKRDLVGYVGKTLMFDRAGKTKTMVARLKDVRKIFD